MFELLTKFTSPAEKFRLKFRIVAFVQECFESREIVIFRLNESPDV